MLTPPLVVIALGLFERAAIVQSGALISEVPETVIEPAAVSFRAKMQTGSSSSTTPATALARTVEFWRMTTFRKVVGIGRSMMTSTALLFPLLGPVDGGLFTVTVMSFASLSKPFNLESSRPAETTNPSFPRKISRAAPKAPPSAALRAPGGSSRPGCR